MSVKELYRAEVEHHMDAGDDLMNALARVAEAGCPPEVLAELESELDDEDDEDE